VQEKHKVRRRLDAVVDCEAPVTFYMAEEGGEMVSWRRNNRRRVEFFNASVSGTREEGDTPILKGERITWGGVIEPPQNEGFIDQDQLERFSAKHEHNQHMISIQYYILSLSKLITY
jgi:hypothetical protein